MTTFGHQDRLDPHATRGTQLGDVQTLLAESQLTPGTMSYRRTKAVARTHGNEVTFRFYFKRVTAGRKVNVIICEGDSDPAPNGVVDTTVVGGVQTILDTSAARLKKNAFTIDEPTVDDQGNVGGYYPYDVRCRAPYTWAAVYADGATAAGDTIKVEAYEVLTQ